MVLAWEWGRDGREVQHRHHGIGRAWRERDRLRPTERSAPDGMAMAARGEGPSYRSADICDHPAVKTTHPPHPPGDSPGAQGG